MTEDDQPLLDTLLEMTVSSVERAHLDEHTLMMVRLGALAAENAPPSSYLLNFAAATDSLDAEDIRSALIAVAPIIGTPRVVSAASAIFAALGIAVSLEDAIRSGELST
jgi:alkylhydroperoxidase/carboxymuconolactone decarboxylase family protein YurZ